MSRARLTLLMTLALCAYLPSSAGATQKVKLHVSLSPERLGAGTTIIFNFEVLTPRNRVPPPLTELSLSYPDNLGVATSGLGLATCSRATLEAKGTKGCPANSHMGYGSAIVEVPIGPEILREPGQITTFLAPLQNGNLGLLFYANAKAPVSAQLVFSGLVLPAPLPFGGNLDIQVPLIPSIPEAPDAAVVKLRATIGPLHLTYYERVHGKTLAYQPNGIRLPEACPHGGFAFSAEFGFADGTGATAHSTVPCPKT